MTYEVRPTGVDAGHWRAAILLVGLIAAAILATAVIARPPGVASTRSSTIETDPMAILALGARLECHDLDEPACKQATRAALQLIGPADGTIAGADAWRSLLCNSTFDCPSTRLTPDATPLGSVVVTFTSGPAAWINVIVRPSPAANGVGAVPIAWLIPRH